MTHQREKRSGRHATPIKEISRSPARQSPALLLLFILLPTHLAFGQDQRFEGKVIGVTDGDTIRVLHGMKSERIRLYGIDCPEKRQDFGRRAKKETSDLVFGKTVMVVPKAKDRYGRTVAVAELAEGTNVNHLLVGRGLCWWFRRYAPKDRELSALEKQARARKIGLWSQPKPIPPWEFRDTRGQVERYSEGGVWP